MITKGLYLNAVCAVAVLALSSGASRAKDPKTIITGAQMEITGGGKTVVFSGGARVEKGQSVLTADNIIQDKKNNRVDASGNVVFNTVSSSGEPMKGSSQKAYYDLEGERGELFEGSPEIRYYMKTSTTPVILRAGDITFDTKKEELYAKDKVEIVTSSVTAYAPFAVFVQKEKKITLTGPVPQPQVIYYEGGKPNRYFADSVTFLAGGDRITLKGNVKVMMTVEDKKKGKPGK